ncbi:putative protein TPRXL, partial [Acyrthosiphon pisum]|uniref:Uncharacterized protein n=1 Tax=Acyrthosiphon pisum TaxID=7029 RepID=A0A8R2FDG3_ACYPI
MSNISEVTFKSPEVDMTTPCTESNENSCEIASKRCDQFSSPALRPRHSSMPNTEVQMASAGDATDVELEFPSADNAADLRLESPSTGDAAAIMRLEFPSADNAADLGLESPSTGDAAAMGSESPSTGDAAAMRLESPSVASTQEPAMIASQPAACNDLRRQTVSAEPSSGPSEIIVANYASPTFRLYSALLNKAIVTPISTEVVTDPPFVSSPAEFSPTESSPFQSPPSESSPSVHLTSESSPLASSPLH